MQIWFRFQSNEEGTNVFKILFGFNFRHLKFLVQLSHTNVNIGWTLLKLWRHQSRAKKRLLYIREIAGSASFSFSLCSAVFNLIRTDHLSRKSKIIDFFYTHANENFIKSWQELKDNVFKRGFKRKNSPYLQVGSVTGWSARLAWSPGLASWRQESPSRPRSRSGTWPTAPPCCTTKVVS